MIEFIFFLIQFYRGWKSGDKEIWKDIQTMKRIGTDFGITIRWATKWFKQHRQKETKSKSSKPKRSKIKSEVKKEASPSRPEPSPFIRLVHPRSFVRLENPSTSRIISPHRPLATSRRHQRKKVEKPTSNVISSLYKIEYQAAQR